MYEVIRIHHRDTENTENQDVDCFSVVNSSIVDNVNWIR
jgi:hypothetical protein